MASSGTVTGPTVDIRLRPFEGHDTVLLMGRVRIKSSAQIDAGDLTLRTIKNAIFTPYYTQDKAGPPMVLYGSVTVAGSLMNNVFLRVVRGSIVPHTGTQHIGTRLHGTISAGFFIAGA